MITPGEHFVVEFPDGRFVVCECVDMAQRGRSHKALVETTDEGVAWRVSRALDALRGR